MLFSSGSVEFLIVGLGNPGSEYDLTRHNVGFRALDFLAGACNTEVRRLKHMALTGKGTLGGHSVLFMKPQTYMNRSGQAVQDAAPCLKSDILTHGDYCLPNIMLSNWKFSGFIDVGSGGLGDRHMDLLWGRWSLRFNLKTTRFCDRFLDAYGREDIEPELLRAIAAIESFF